MNFRRTITGLLIVLLSLIRVPSVFAHGDEPRLEISVERINPGGVIEVRGVDFEMDEQITLELIGSDVTIPLGEFVADVEGGFAQIVSLPVDLKEGTYFFSATTNDHIIKSPSFVVTGVAVSGEEDGQRAEDDALFAPMPTYAPGVSVTPMAVVETLDTPVSTESTIPWTSVFFAVSVLVVIFLIILLKRQRA